jgi:hypothetical protein
MTKSRLGPALWLVVGVSFILLGYQNCDFLGSGLEPYSSESSFEAPDFPEDPGDDTDIPGVSTIYGISEWGNVSGCASREDFPNEILTVTFYVDGPAGKGERIGETEANETVPGAACVGHRFQFEIPENYRDGMVHQLYAYAGTESPEGLIGGGPRAFAAYNYSTTGKNYFEFSVKPLMQGECTQCHGPGKRSPVPVYEYETAFQYLLVPSPFNGGTTTNNSLINHISSSNHTGGNYCGQGSVICLNIRAWWNVEFQ